MAEPQNDDYQAPPADDAPPAEEPRQRPRLKLLPRTYT